MIQSNRLWAVACITVMVLLILAGWFVGIQPALAAITTAESDRAAVEGQIATQQATIATLEAQQKKLPELTKKYDALLKSIPTTPGTSSFIDGLDALALQSGVLIKGFTVGEPLAYTVPLSAVPVPVATEPTTDPAAAPVPPAVPEVTPAVTNPLITPDNFVGIVVTIDLAGTYESVLGFVNGLQSGDRLFLVTGITSAKNADAGAENVVAAHVTGYIYVLADK